MTHAVSERDACASRSSSCVKWRLLLIGLLLLRSCAVNERTSLPPPSHFTPPHLVSDCGRRRCRVLHTGQARCHGPGAQVRLASRSCCTKHVARDGSAARHLLHRPSFFVSFSSSFSPLPLPLPLLRVCVVLTLRIRYNLIARCLDIVKTELARASSVCSSKVRVALGRGGGECVWDVRCLWCRSWRKRVRCGGV